MRCHPVGIQATTDALLCFDRRVLRGISRTIRYRSGESGRRVTSLDVAAASRSSDQALTLSVINPGWEEATSSWIYWVDSLSIRKKHAG